MGTKEKLIRRLQNRPKVFTFDEAKTLLNYFGYNLSNKGKTSGSRIMFVKNGFTPITIHKPHPNNELKAYQVKTLIDKLKEEDLI